MDTSIVDLESEFLELCRQYPNGVNHKILENSFNHISQQERLDIINNLLKKQKIDLLSVKNEPGVYLYRIRNENNSSHVGVTDQKETIVYNIIKESTNLGLSINDMKFKTKLPQTTLNKILKILENKKLIKTVKSIHGNRKKVYMLFDQTPDLTVTGGVWYSENEFESEFVRILNEQCARLLDERLEESIKKYPYDPFLRRTNSSISSFELVSLINDMGISTIKLSIKDIESILETLIHDGKIEKIIIVSNDIKQNFYRSIKTIIDSSSIIRNPCGICPVFHDCHENGLITPLTCIYLNQWLNF